MHETKKKILFGFVILAFGGIVFSARSADAQHIQTTYKIQVKYRFFDTDYTYWSTVYETDNEWDARFYLAFLNWAKEQGTLNSVAPNSYWRYVAVDARMIQTYRWRWQYLEPLQLAPIGW